MNAESITAWLETVGVPTEVVSVGTEADNAWCLLREEGAGEDNAVTWEVFWREQGNRYDWARFTNEQVACHYLFGRLTWAQVARGAVGVLPAAAGTPVPAQPVAAPAAPPAPAPGQPAADLATPPAFAAQPAAAPAAQPGPAAQAAPAAPVAPAPPTPEPQASTPQP
jgi:hypothetical protein